MPDTEDAASHTQQHPVDEEMQGMDGEDEDEVVTEVLFSFEAFEMVSSWLWSYLRIGPITPLDLVLVRSSADNPLFSLSSFLLIVLTVDVASMMLILLRIVYAWRPKLSWRCGDKP